MKKVFIITSFLPFIFSCLHKEEKQSTPILIPIIQKENKKISIEFIGSIKFGKSFSFLQDPTLSKKEIARLDKETEKSNPFKMDTTNESLRKRFEELGMVKERELLLTKFKYDSKPEFSFTDQFNKIVKIRFEKDSVGFDNNKIIASANTDTSQIRLDSYIELEYALLDIIPGGNKELVIINWNHVSNTDLYTLEAFEIKTWN